MGHNMFAYCDNNPISRQDSVGANWFTDMAKKVSETFSFVLDLVTSVFDSKHDTHTNEVLSSVETANDLYSLFKVGSDAIDDTTRHTMNVVAVGTQKKPKIIKLKVSKSSDNIENYINICKQSYKMMKINELGGGVEISGKTWADLNVDQRFILVHQMCIWDRNTYNDIILSYGKKATNIAGGITYGISDIFPED